MRKIYNIFTLLAFLVVMLSSCDSYFDTKLHQNMDYEKQDVYATVRLVENGTIGAYQAFGFWKFYGRNVIAIGDIAADNANANATSGYFLNSWNYTISDGGEDHTFIWQYGYAVIDRATRTINGAKALLAKEGTVDSEKIKLNALIAECYGLRAIANHVLVQVFGLPYGADSNPHGGLVLVDQEPISTDGPMSKLSRASVEDTYALILKDIKAAKDAFALASGVKKNSFFITPAAISAIEARVLLHMAKYPEAAAAAQNAITLRASGDVSNEEYVTMWENIDISNEDIFTISKTVDDNLSANSLNTLYGNYKVRVTDDLLAVFNTNDIRKKLIKGNVPRKFQGIKESDATSNIPVFRKSEMYLIMAEAYAQQNLVAQAQNALFYTAKRDTDITAETMLPNNKADLLDFISVERRREFFQEGHRWYDARRTGEKIDVNGGGYKNYDVKKFVYPIPIREINSGSGVEQNENWSDNLPQKD